MRQKRLIEEGNPCDIDFTDRTIQTVADIRRKGPTVCPNRDQCLRRNEAEGIQCYRRLAVQMAGYILRNKSRFEQAVEEEKAGFLSDAPDRKFWVFRDGIWQVVQGKGNVIDEIVAFARLIIDLQPEERRLFTQDGMKKIEFGPADALHNAMLDLDDVYGEVGYRNPFR